MALAPENRSVRECPARCLKRLLLSELAEKIFVVLTGVIVGSVGRLEPVVPDIVDWRFDGIVKCGQQTVRLSDAQSLICEVCLQSGEEGVIAHGFANRLEAQRSFVIDN